MRKNLTDGGKTECSLQQFRFYAVIINKKTARYLQFSSESVPKIWKSMRRFLVSRFNACNIFIFMQNEELPAYYRLSDSKYVRTSEAFPSASACRAISRASRVL